MTAVSIVDGDVVGGTPVQQLSSDVLIAPSLPEEHVAYAGTSRGKGRTGENFTIAQQARGGKGLQRRYVARRPQYPSTSDPTPEAFAETFLEHHTIIVSGGILNFEESAWSSRKGYDVKNFLSDDRVEPGALSGSSAWSEELRSRFIDSFLLNFPA